MVWCIGVDIDIEKIVTIGRNISFKNPHNIIEIQTFNTKINKGKWDVKITGGMYINGSLDKSSAALDYAKELFSEGLYCGRRKGMFKLTLDEFVDVDYDRLPYSRFKEHLGWEEGLRTQVWKEITSKGNKKNKVTKSKQSATLF